MFKYIKYKSSKLGHKMSHYKTETKNPFNKTNRRNDLSVSKDTKYLFKKCVHKN